MNTKRTNLTANRRKLLILLFAGILAMSIHLGEGSFRKLPGIDLSLTAYACQHSGGGGC